MAQRSLDVSSSQQLLLTWGLGPELLLCICPHPALSTRVTHSGLQLPPSLAVPGATPAQT